MSKNGVPNIFKNPFFENLDTLKIPELYGAITKKAGYGYFQATRVHIVASEASSTLCIIIFMVASNEGLDFDTDLCLDLAELMISPDQDVLSAGVPHELRVKIDNFTISIKDF